jgi:regulator of sigma E protease
MDLLSITLKGGFIMAGQLLLGLSILVVLHEFGHYITAKWFKCRVEKFYLFFDPWFSLFKKKIGDTVYGIGWLPLGGYVKISGMVDESMDKEQLNKPAEPWEFRSKPAWQRLIIMLGGVIVNVLLAFIIYAMVLCFWGEKKIEPASIKYGLSFGDSVMNKMGFRNGDNIIAIDNVPVEDFDDAIKKLIVSDSSATVIRDGKTVVLNLPVDLLGQLISIKKKSENPLIAPRLPVYVMGVPDTAAAYKSGLRKGDYIVGIDSVKTDYYDEFKAAAKKYAGKDVRLAIKRNGTDTTISMHIKDDATVGFMPPNSHEEFDSLGIYKYTVKKYPFLASFPAGVRRTGEELSFYMAQMKKIFTPKTGGIKGIGGFKGMAKAYGDIWDWEHFWTMTAMLSIILAFMNILPIPALDGGHVLFTLIEMVTGRKPSDKVLEYAQIAGMVLLLGLMLFANGNDWFGWGK